MMVVVVVLEWIKYMNVEIPVTDLLLRMDGKFNFKNSENSLSDASMK